jgi:hypothetical protein
MSDTEPTFEDARGKADIDQLVRPNLDLWVHGLAPRGDVCKFLMSNSRSAPLIELILT